MTNKFTDATQANSFFKDINFTSIVDTIKNIYMSDLPPMYYPAPALGMAFFVRYMDRLWSD